MRLVKNSGNDRVLDVLASGLGEKCSFDCATSEFTLFAFGEVRHQLARCRNGRMLLPATAKAPTALLGTEHDRSYRNRFLSRWLARLLLEWLKAKCEVRMTLAPLPQSIYVLGKADGGMSAIMGNCPLTTAGLGLTPGNQFGMIQFEDDAQLAGMFASFFTQVWNNTPDRPKANEQFFAQLRTLVDHRAPQTAYQLALANLFSNQGEALDEERIVKSATGIKNSVVWKKLFRFQKDGVVGAIDKLERFGGCIIADSVGLGKTFEALAVIKYYELRNDRVLVLVPKRLRDNWTQYKANDERNALAEDRFHYDVLNHTDLSRDGGESGDIDLAHVNWGNYDLVVIDESHNFRNKKTPKAGGETRYDRLMRRFIQEGVKTRVLMLSATPVNNRLADLKNQIAFVTEGRDDAFAEQGIANISATVRFAQKQFNFWLKLSDDERRPAKLIDMLGFDYFQLLDLLTIARSRKHVEKYYGTKETGKFPERMQPLNFRPTVDSANQFRPISEINDEIRKLKLSAYSPLSYVLPTKMNAYDEKYSQKVKGGTGLFKQIDREKSLIHLIRINLLKRMESAIPSFTLTLSRQLADVKTILGRIEAHAEVIEGLDVQTLDIDDPAFEALLIGNKVKVLLQDVDRVKWRQDLIEDRDRLTELLASARQVNTSRDAKLAQLMKVIHEKVTNPLNPGNRKAIVFTAFADTARYLYDAIAPWAAHTLKLNTALVSGDGGNRHTIPGLRQDMSTILSAFSPLSKERSADYADEGNIDLLIATDCISEGQNLQDCDYLVNYDIHWNPVRIIQRFGRIDRIGSQNTRIQLVNFWPDMELEEYINLESRVGGKMVLLDVSATGEENVIEQQSGDPMNDLEYRRKQLLKLQDAVIDLEDLSNGVSIADLTLNDYRIDLAQLPKDEREKLGTLPFGTFAVVAAADKALSGAIFCLRAMTAAPTEAGYPLAPHYLVYVGDNGEVIYQYTQARPMLDLLKGFCAHRAVPDLAACQRFDQLTKDGERMEHYQKLLAAAVASIAGKHEERAAASLFAPGGTHAKQGEFSGMDDFEVVMFLAILAIP